MSIEENKIIKQIITFCWIYINVCSAKSFLFMIFEIRNKVWF